jgi:hypothetical protein
MSQYCSPTYIGDPHPASITKTLRILDMINLNPIATYTSVYNLYFYDDTVPLIYHFVVVGSLADHHCMHCDTVL